MPDSKSRKPVQLAVIEAVSLWNAENASGPSETKPGSGGVLSIVIALLTAMV